MSKAKSRSALGTNPLSQGIFSKTVSPETLETKNFNNQDLSNQDVQSQDLFNKESSFNKIDSTESIPVTSKSAESTLVRGEAADQATQQTKRQNQEKRIKKKESSFLIEESVERVNLRLSIEINDWLDSLLKQGKRKHGRKIPKETWVQAALELFRAMPVDWQAIDSEEALQQALSALESRIKSEE